MSYKESIQEEKRKQDFKKAYYSMCNKYSGDLYNDSNEFIGNKHFGISKDLFDTIFVTDIVDIPQKDIVISFLKPWLEGVIPNPDWRSVDGVSGKWQRKSNSKVGEVYVQSIRKINTHTAIDFDFCKMFPNHWFMHCADYEKDNKKNNYPIFAHNKKTNKIDGYIFPIMEYGK
jgi:hypothetical protein